MAINYQKRLPHDAGSGEALQEFPAPFLAHQRRYSDNGSTSSVVTLDDRTTMLEVTASGGAAAIKWIPTSDTAASVVATTAAPNYDHVIPANTMRRFVVPQETAGITSVAGANVANGCYRRVAWISIGAGSILSSEF